ncbi:SRPBCC family protein [Enteractinococcus helveticum]|uniref:ATPase n=1 Tax=Enteractinococcus helveticum TaxID=1837282 RepID=A0A1B7M0U9_9MICC|nr:SRPBCC domain-containing protein [Enteractinococcus helveticum]OAV61835.1 hypothetical protein A6F49_08065 [Enteractinococcus helveticum]
MTNSFEIRKDVDLPVSPEQVWHAVATPEGQAGWSPDPYMESEDLDIVEERPSRFVVRTPEDAHGAFHAFEYQIQPLDEGSRLTFIHSGDLGNDWQSDFDYAEITGYGWNLYMHTLKQYLTYFAGRPAVYVAAQAPDHANTHQAWQQLEQALGLPDGSAQFTVGDEIRLEPSGLSVIEGIIDYVEPGEDFLAVRSQDGLYRFHSLERIGMPVALGHYRYGAALQPLDEEQRKTEEQAWQAWLQNVFA